MLLERQRDDARQAHGAERHRHLDAAVDALDAHRIGRAHVALERAQEAVQAARLGARRRRVRVEVAIARPRRGTERSDEGIDVVHAIMVARYW